MNWFNIDYSNKTQICCFLLVWYSLLPYFKVNGLYYILWFVARYLIFVNAAINPVTYGLTNEKFRRALRTTTFSKWFFGKNPKKKVHNINTQRLRTDRILIPPITNRINIFYIFRSKSKPQSTKQEHDETSVTNSGGNGFKKY